MIESRLPLLLLLSFFDLVIVVVLVVVHVVAGFSSSVFCLSLSRFWLLLCSSCSWIFSFVLFLLLVCCLWLSGVKEEPK